MRQDYFLPDLGFPNEVNEVLKKHTERKNVSFVMRDVPEILALVISRKFHRIHLAKVTREKSHFIITTNGINAFKGEVIFNIRPRIFRVISDLESREKIFDKSLKGLMSSTLVKVLCNNLGKVGDTCSNPFEEDEPLIKECQVEQADLNVQHVTYKELFKEVLKGFKG